MVRDHLLLVYQSAVTGPAQRAARGIAEAGSQRPHIASPDVVIDYEQRRLLLYFHGLGRNGYPSSRIAQSADGINFELLDSTVFSTYLRGWDYKSEHYLLGMPGVIYRASEPDGDFKPRDQLLFDPSMRHAGVWFDGDILHVLWSRVGDAPEQLLYSRVDLSDPDWNNWRATQGAELLRPERDWEGSALPVMSSLRGELDLPGHELRDPYILHDLDGRLYLYYVGAGEQAIGVALLHMQ